jgi:hypothetical protein
MKVRKILDTTSAAPNPEHRVQFNNDKGAFGASSRAKYSPGGLRNIKNKICSWFFFTKELSEFECRSHMGSRCIPSILERHPDYIFLDYSVNHVLSGFETASVYRRPDLFARDIELPSRYLALTLHNPSLTSVSAIRMFHHWEGVLSSASFF